MARRILTEEHKAKLMAGRNAAREQRREVTVNLRTNFLDASYWTEIASQRGMVLPKWSTPLTTGGMEKWLKRLGMDSKDFRAWSGFTLYQEFVDANKDWPLRAFAGMMLEVKEKNTQ